MTFGRDLVALIYLDANLLANRMRLIARDPRRLIPWLLVLAWIAFTRTIRLTAGSGAQMNLTSSFLSSVAAFVPGVYLLVLGVGISRAAIRAPATFRSPADARFLVGSRLPPRLVVGWLQMRRVVGLMAVSAINVLLIVAFLPFGADSPSRLVPLVLAIGGAYVLLQSIPMLGFFAGRRAPALPVGKLGAALAAVGGASTLVALLLSLGEPPPLPESIQRLLLELPPGAWIGDSYHGVPAAPLLMLAVAAVAVGLTVLVSGDCYPELWDSSARIFTLRRLARERGGHLLQSDVRRVLGRRRRERVPSASSDWVPSGAGAILWKEWLALRRAPVALLLQLALVVGVAGLGAIVGVLIQAGDRRLASSIGFLGASVLLMFNVYSGLRLGVELRNPVWWFSAASLRQRLLAWTGASTVRQALAPCVGFAIAAAMAGNLEVLVVGLLAIPVGIWALRMVSLATYALVPSATDLRGPGRLLRVLLLQACIVPPVIALAVVTVIARSLVAGEIATIPVLAGEGWLLLELTAWLIGRNGLGYAQAEAR